MNKKTDDDKQKGMIKNLVLSAGAVGGLYIYGALKASHQAGLWKHENIRTLWGTSFGSILSVVVSLNCEWEVLDDYLIKRPWQTVFKFNWINLWKEKGLMCKQVIDEAMIPVFRANDIPLNITLKEFCEKTGKELHMFVTELDMVKSVFRLVDINPITHPDWLVLDAIYASCCLPFIFKPFEMVSLSEFSHGVDTSGNNTEISKTHIYLDGAILCAFPYDYCLKHSFVREEEVFGIYLVKPENKFSEDDVKDGKTFKNTNLLDFMKIFSLAICDYANIGGRYANIGGLNSIDSVKSFLVKLIVDTHERFDMRVVQTEEKRVEYITKGVEMFYQFLDENSREKKFAETLAEGGHEVRLDEIDTDLEVDVVCDLDSHRIS